MTSTLNSPISTPVLIGGPYSAKYDHRPTGTATSDTMTAATVSAHVNFIFGNFRQSVSVVDFG
jgi:hypothetical protein